MKSGCNSRIPSFLTFRPLLKQKIWGGEKIVPFKGMDSCLPAVGESWEVSGLPCEESVVDGGEYNGVTLGEMVKRFGNLILGKKVRSKYGDMFPLLIKLINMNSDASIQVHPNDETAMRRHGCLGKAEMWYVVEADENAHLIAGFSCQTDRHEFKEKLDEGTYMDVLRTFNVHEGDVFYVHPGCVHNLGAGVLAVEIQEASDITYRLHDFNRHDSNGQPRELHVCEALEAADFSDIDGSAKIEYSHPVNRSVCLLSTPYFSVSLYDFTSAHRVDYSDLDSFVALVCIEGECIICDNEGGEIKLHRGCSVLISAAVSEITINPVSSVKIIATYV